jgi:hypothetical protein
MDCVSASRFFILLARVFSRRIKFSLFAFLHLLNRFARQPMNSFPATGAIRTNEADALPNVGTSYLLVDGRGERGDVGFGLDGGVHALHQTRTIHPKSGTRHHNIDDMLQAP